MDKVTLGSIMTLHRGYDLPYAQRKPGSIPVISSSGISGAHSVAKLDGENVITGRYGTIGDVFYHDGPCWPLNTTLYVEDFHGNSPHYVAYLLEVLLDAMKIDGTDKSTVPGVDRNVLHDLIVPYISDLDLQKSVTSVLTAIDDKIANNKKIMIELKDVARLIYDYWFTQFDFPDKDGKPYRSSGGEMVWSNELKRNIPIDWHVVKIGSLITVAKGISYTSEDLISPGKPMVNLASFNIDGTIKLAGMKTYAGIVDADKTIHLGDLLMCVTQQTAIDPTGKTNVLGKAFRLPDVFDEAAVISTDVIMIAPIANRDYSAILEQLFKRPEIHKRISGFANGTKIKHLDVAGAMDFYHAFPTSGDLIQRFAELSDSLLSKEGLLLRENMQLQTLRDWLLPMLISGQATMGE